MGVPPRGGAGSGVGSWRRSDTDLHRAQRRSRRNPKVPAAPTGLYTCLEEGVKSKSRRRAVETGSAAGAGGGSAQNLPP